MKSIGIYLTICSILINLGFGANEPDLITDLPGYDGVLPYTQYSGYLNGSKDGNIQLHYWFVTSQGDPDEDPLVLWLNGGPGCSSLDGMLSEHGPLLMGGEGEGLVSNEWAWNKIANVIYLESPACVGFSFAVDGNCAVSDTEVADENFLALLHFVKKFPEFEGRDLFITGESYGGVYIPTLTEKIHNSETVLRSMLKGFAIGNGLLSYRMNTNSLITFGYTHGIISTLNYRQLLRTCRCASDEVQCDFLGGAIYPRCYAYLYWALVNIYNLNLNLYDTTGICFKEGYNSTSPMNQGDAIREMLTKEHIFHGLETVPRSQRGQKVRRSTEDDVIIACVDSTAETEFLNNPEVREALHIDPRAPEWAVCTNLPYRRQYFNMATVLTTLVDAGIQGLFYNGDVDGVCNFIGDELFVDGLGYTSTTIYAPWYIPNGQIGGWWKSYGSGLQFSTVRGAGHMVPQYKPMAAYVLWEAFLSNNYK